MRRVFDLFETPIDDGVTVVEASAGTGKTYCLTGLVLRLLLEGRVDDVGRVLVVTFTNAATNELVTRLRAALRHTYRLFLGEVEAAGPFFRQLLEKHGGDEGRRILRRALLRFDELGVFTIHGFCKRVLEETAFESGIHFQSEFIDNDEPLLLRAAQDFWRRHLYCAGTPAAGGGDLAAAVAANRGWTPERFLADYRTWRRHPHTVILPPAEDLEAVVAGLEAAAEALAGTWKRVRLRTLLASLRYKKNAPIDPERLSPLLDDVEAFCAGRHPAGLPAVAGLSGDRLRKWVKKVDHDAVARHPFVRASDRLAAAVDAFEHGLRCRFLVEVDRIFDRAKRDTGTLAFDDLLRQVHAALCDPVRGGALKAVVRGRYQAALIDEFQDTDLIQYEIFRGFFAPGPLYLIGDPKQAIYRFRGADVFAYMAAKDEADRGYTLDRNWRSDPALLAAVNALFGHAPRAFVFDSIPFEAVTAGGQEDGEERESLAGDDRAPLQWLWLPKQPSKVEGSRLICRAVAAEIVELLESGLEIRAPGGRARPLAPADVAVLVRTNRQGQAVQEALRRLRVPAVISRAGDVFESEEMAELGCVLAAVAEPAASSRLRAAWATRLWGDDASAILDLERDDEAWQERLDELEELRRDWLRRGFMVMIQRLFRHRDIRRRLLATAGGERRLTNLFHAVEVLHQAILERRLSPAGLLTWLAVERSPNRVHDSETTELRLESDAQAVQISTVHKSKGLEYGIVFCPFLWEARPEERPPVTAHLDPRRVVFDFGSEDFDQHRDLAEAERLAEDLRLAYVALTRARHRCYVVWGEVGRGSAFSSVGYLLRRHGEASLEEPGAFARRAIEQVRGEASAWHQILREMVDDHRGLMELEEVETKRPPGPNRAWSGAAGAGRELVRPRLPDLEGRLVPWRMASFSSLARPGLARPGLARPGPVRLDLSRPGRALEAPDHLDPQAPDRPVIEEPTARGIFAFARGARAGTCLHEVLEHCDFAFAAGPGNHRRIAEALRRHGLDEAEAHRGGAGFDPAAAVAGMLRRVASFPLPGAGFALAEVSRLRQMAEWQFYAPLAERAPRDLARLFRDHAAGAVADYAHRLEELDGRRIHGFLTGFVDLVFTHGERWYVVDWKSNHLGDAPADYGAEGVWRAMSRHHYVLQYHLYVLALHRFLRHRLPGYDYQRHFGGAYYVFLRGVDDSAAGDPPADEITGWHADRPPVGLVDALEGFLG